MYDLSYFNLGFRSDNVSNTLLEMKSKGTTSQPLLEDAVSIIKDCLKTKENDTIILKFSSGKGYETNTINPILRELFPGEDPPTMITKLKKVYFTISSIENKKDFSEREIDQAIDFFSNIADICLSNSIQQAILS